MSHSKNAVAAVMGLIAPITFSCRPALALPPGAKPQRPAARPPAKPASAGHRATLEMVFVLDTTGSMGGLLEGAKQRIWGIVNEVMSSPARPDVRVGLVAYRDHGDSYVTKVLPLTSDLDRVYSTLTGFRAEGGGDTPEDVRQALADGVSRAGWSARSRQVAQVLFLVGDAPPHDDYTNEPSCQATTAAAAARGLIVNAIQCGPAPDTRAVWQDLARRGEGRYFAIAEDGGVAAIPTPYDRRLGELGAKIGSTYLAYGAAPRRAAAAGRAAATEEHVAAAAAGGGGFGGAAADRAVNKALNRYAYDGDLLQDVENGAVKVDALKPTELPDDLAKLSPEARKKEIDRRLTARKAVQAQILALSKQRDAYLAAERRKRAPAGKQQGFDGAVAAALREEAKSKGIAL